MHALGESPNEDHLESCMNIKQGQKKDKNKDGKGGSLADEGERMLNPKRRGGALKRSERSFFSL